ncbi:uncharacterized protein LOC134177481 [Corticium candelabrum]|uniref:uncharacterized protein LOC134177481 n=1 Tax=Corticium candelabrum TaxID=121492 RepID=UPI002E258D7D|nr:uncharacterized protein LOC134177481 [Corticium candelabrum]
MSRRVTLNYVPERVQCVEKFYGVGFLNSGGETTCKDLVQRLAVKEGDSVLDVGSGSGGMAFYLAENVGATVTGVDSCSSLVTLTRHRSEMKSLTDKVTFLEKRYEEVRLRASNV